jgi:hypothetical protein
MNLAMAHFQLGGDILVTNSPLLLTNNGNPALMHINTRTPLEAVKIVGLFLRSREIFTYQVFKNAQASFNKHLFYWVLVRYLLPNMWRYFAVCVEAGNVRHDDSLQLSQAILDRAVRAFQARDAIGIVFYGGDPEPRETMIYHFDYLSLLLAGAIDAQCRIAHRTYSIKGKERWASFRLNEQRKTFIDYLDAAGASELAQYIRSTEVQDFLTLLYETRNVIHGAGMLPIVQIDLTNNTRGVYFEVPVDIKDKLWKASETTGGPNEWGLLKTHGGIILEPYSFASSLVGHSLYVINSIAKITEVERLSPDQTHFILPQEPSSDSAFVWGSKLSLLG